MTDFKLNYKSIDFFDAVKLVHDYDVDMADFNLYLVGREEYHDTDTYIEPGIEYMQANRFIKNIKILNAIDAYRPILVHMKTEGGDVFEGLAMYDAMRAIKNPITIINYNHASSMSSVVFQGANKRIMMPNSYFMYHQGSLSTSGTFKQVQTGVEFDKIWNNTMLDIYTERMKTTVGSKVARWGRKRIKDWLLSQMNKSEEVYLTASKTVELGLADEVFTSYSTIFKYTKQELEVK